MNIAVLYSSEAQYGIIEGLKNLKHFVIPYYYGSETRNFQEGILIRLSKKKIRLHDIKTFNKKIIEIINYSNYNSLDLIIIIKGHELTEKANTALKSSNILKIQWTIDTVKRWPGQASLLNLMDKTFFQDGDDIHLHKRGEWLPLGFDDSIFRYNKKKEIDVLLIGNIQRPFYNKRRDCFIRISYLAKKGFRVIFAGSKPDKELRRIFNSNGVKIIGRLSLEKYAALISKSKICVNIHQDDGGKAINPMFFAIPSTGTLQLTDSSSYLKEWLEPGKHYYETIPETICIDISRLLSQKYLSFEIANEVTIKHSYNGRAEYIMTHL
ncbi:MAG: hypothetical protein GX660_12190 [Clostridiaceae bacterium]|nr:hypothetical protein [Clostridiaceae bacterium]